MSTRTTYRWEFRRQELSLRTFAEAELEDVGRPGEDRYMVQVYLVRDEMLRPDPSKKGAVFDPEQRVGQRIYVGASHADDCRLLAYLAPREGERRAYTLIWNVLRENQDQVRKFGDDWLTATICGETELREEGK